MSAYNPPIYNNAIFNTEDFEEANPTTLTIDYADGHYLKFPYAQGNETFQDKSVTFSETTTPSSSTISQATGNLVIAGNEANSNTIIRSKNSSGTDVTTLQVNASFVTVNTDSGLLIENNKPIILSGKSQNTTYTGWVGNGTNTYSNPSLTINDSGKITAISSSSSSSTVGYQSGTTTGFFRFHILISNYSSWGINDFFTMRVSFVQNNNARSSSPLIYQNNYSIAGYINFYPARYSNGYGGGTTFTNLVCANLNNNINGTTNFTGINTSVVDGNQVSPNGRITWFYNGAVGTNSLVYLCCSTTVGGQYTFQINSPDGTSSSTQFQYDVFLEIVDKGNAPAGTTITTDSTLTNNINITY